MGSIFLYKAFWQWMLLYRPLGPLGHQVMKLTELAGGGLCLLHVTVVDTHVCRSGVTVLRKKNGINILKFLLE